MAPYPERRGGTLTGFFCVDIRTKKTRIRDRFDNLKDAEGFEAYVKATGQRPPWAASKLSGPTFADAAKACEEAGGPKGKWKRGRDKSVIQRLRYIVSRWGHVPVAEFGMAQYDAIVESLEDRPGRNGQGDMSGATINRYLDAASAVIHYASKRPERFPGITRVEAPKRPEGAHKIAWYTHEQEAAVCRVLDPISALMARVLAATGLRAGELLSLEPGDIEDEWVRLWRTKTDRPRSVPIAPEMARELRAAVATGTLHNYGLFYRKLKAAVGKCGYSSELNVHALRHTTATRLILAGINPVIVQKWLGHRQIKTTMRYTHLNDDDLLQAAKKLLPNMRANSEQAANTENIIPLAPMAADKLSA